MATPPMDVDSGCGSSSQAEECLPPNKVVGKDSNASASASNLSSSDMVVGPFAKLREGITIIEEIQKLISNSATIWNKQQCKRIADRCSNLSEILERMVQDGNESVAGQASSGGCSSGEAVDGLLDVLQKVKIIISGYVNESQAITRVVCRTNNPTAFMELHEELDAAMAKLGILGMESKMNMLGVDAEEDKEGMLQRLSQMSLKSGQSAGTNHAERIAQVVLDRTTDLDVTELVRGNPDISKLPSYLKISESEIILGDSIRKYVRYSDQDPEKEVGWAEVKRGKWLNCDVAIKVFKCGDVTVDRAAWNHQELLKEAGSLVELAHPHVVQLVGFGQYQEQSVFVMECMDGDLRNYMKEKMAQSEPKLGKPFTDSEELEIITQFARGLYFIHTRGYAHGDLKCSNLVVNANRGKYLEVKVADLRGSQKRGHWNAKAFEQASRTRRPRWTAPEALEDSWDPPPSWESLTQMDIYSFGMTCYEIVTGKYPFDGIRDKAILVQKIKDKERPELPEHLDEQLRVLITSCWDQDPAKRPSFVSIFQFLEYTKSLQKDRSSGMILMMLQQFKNKLETWWQRQREGEFSSSDFQPKHLKHFPESRYLEIEPEKLERVASIGLGASATVYKVTWLSCIFAEKELKKPYTHFKLVQQEIEALIKVSRHPYMVHLVGLSVKPKGKCSIVMEYIDGNLRKLMDTRKLMDADGHLKKRKADWRSREKPFDFHEELQIISKIALGMAYLHSRNLVHRDLKPQNVLAQEYVGTNPTIVVKIVDFGLSHLEESLDSSDTESLFTESSDAESSIADSGDASKETKTGNAYYRGLGTGFYRAPEMLPPDAKSEDVSKLGLPDEGSQADLPGLKATDVFSFAMTCYEVLTGEHPCSGLPMNAYAEIRRGYRPTWPEPPESEPKSRVNLKRLVENCWETIPQKRPTFDHICKELLEISKLPQE